MPGAQSKRPAPRGTGLFATGTRRRRLSWRQLVVACRGRDVLLVDRRRVEQEAVEPGHVLHVIRVRVQGVEVAVGIDGHVGVVTEEGTAETIPGVDRMGR